MSQKVSQQPEAFDAGVSLFDDTEDAATIADVSALFEQQEVPDYPPIAHYGRFEILGRIATGGMAEIFLAREVGFQGAIRHVVIKRVLPHVADNDDFIKMFLHEARVCTRLYHPNVCHLYECGEIDDTYFMAMEWVHGIPLRRLIRRARDHGGIPMPLALKIISVLCEALHYAHTAKDANGRPLNIVHRDVSPHNVMVSFKGVVKLLDFGIANSATQDQETEAGVIKGKYSYLSPEQCQGGAIDHRSDIFALGICLYETITGTPLYHRGAVLNTMTAIVNEPVPSARGVIKDVPVEVDAIVQKALAKKPEDRYQTAREMRDAIEDFLYGRGEIVDPNRIGKLLDRIFDDQEREPLTGAHQNRTGSYQAFTPSGALAPESGSFGPFGRQQRVEVQAPAVDAVEIDVSILEPSTEQPLGSLPEDMQLLAAEMRPSRTWLWVALGLAVVGIGAAVAAALL